MSRSTCEGLRKDGGRCLSFALSDSPYCFLHADPEAARAARSKGAVNAGKLRSLHGRRQRLDSPKKLLAFCSDLALDTLSGVIEPDVSRATAYALSLQIKLLEMHDLEERLQTLEAAAASQQQPTRMGARR